MLYLEDCSPYASDLSALDAIAVTQLRYPIHSGLTRPRLIILMDSLAGSGRKEWSPKALWLRSGVNNERADTGRDTQTWPPYPVRAQYSGSTIGKRSHTNRHARNYRWSRLYRASRALDAPPQTLDSLALTLDSIDRKHTAITDPLMGGSIEVAYKYQ